MESKFFTFYQNNTGGSFVIDETAGICETVIIEAKNANHANEIAEEKGLYFNGCNSGEDCSCCGDRWSEVDERDAEIAPSVYSVPIEECHVSIFRKYCFTHYLEGRIEKTTFK